MEPYLCRTAHPRTKCADGEARRGPFEKPKPAQAEERGEAEDHRGEDRFGHRRDTGALRGIDQHVADGAGEEDTHWSNHQPFAPRVPPPQLLKVTPSTASAMPLHASAEGCSPKMRTVINTVRARLILLATVVGDMPSLRCKTDQLKEQEMKSPPCNAEGIHNRLMSPAAHGLE